MDTLNIINLKSSKYDDHLQFDDDKIKSTTQI